MLERLFIGIYPAGIVYADRAKEEHGDYRKIAFLPYDTLSLVVYVPGHDLLPDVETHAAIIAKRKGKKFATDKCGHYVTLGRKG